MIDSPFVDKLKEFSNDDVLLEAVRALFNSACDLNTLEDDSVQSLGESSKAFIRARGIIKAVFDDIQSLKTQSDPAVDNINQV